MPRRIAVELVGVIVNDDSQSWERLDEREPHGVARLAKVAADRRWEIIFLTESRRESRLGEQLGAQRWLESKGFTLPSVYVTSGSRGQIAAALNLDLVIDSRPEAAVDVVAESDARTILIWPAERGTLPPEARRPEINLARTFAECLDMLTAVDDPQPKRDGMFAWLRRILGMKTASA
jgi:hypothetical protein